MDDTEVRQLDLIKISSLIMAAVLEGDSPICVASSRLTPRSVEANKINSHQDIDCQVCVFGHFKYLENTNKHS